MSALVYVTLAVRRTARASYGTLAALAFAFLVIVGAFTDETVLSTEHAVVAAAWAAVVVALAVKRTRAAHVGEASPRLDVEIALLFLSAVEAAIQLTGGSAGPLQPLVYVLVVLVASLARKPAGLAFAVVAAVCESAIYFVAERRTSFGALVPVLAFNATFAVIGLAMMRTEIARARARSARERQVERDKILQDARLCRLVAASEPGALHEDEKLYRSSVEELRHSAYYILDLLRQSLRLNTAVLLLLDDSEERLCIVEIATDSDDVAPGPFPAGEGAVGAIAKRGLVTSIEHVKPGYTGICYYRNAAKVRTFLGVPVVEHGHVRGALCADRMDAQVFATADEGVMRAAAEQLVRAMENERVFVQLERSRAEQGVLFRASQSLGAAMTEEAVTEAALGAAREIAAYDFAALTAFDAHSRTHTVRCAVGEGADAVSTLRFRDNSSLTAMAVKNRHYLPYRGEFDASQQVVYTKKANLKGMASLLVLPLVVREGAIGTLALAAKRPGAFGEHARPLLQTLANQLAVSLANASAVRRLEELATTDGLTGCLNKRAFLEELARKIRAAGRFNRRLSLVVTDIDHFKQVNDTYGHASGDLVLKGLGEILRRVKRETDVVARFGGEEFCVLCEETDTDGAVLLAERIRQELAASVLHTELGALRVACSLGVAAFPRDARSAEALFEAADKALYAAKHAGRNRVCEARAASSSATRPQAAVT